jgi:hypothetical protein
MYSGTTFRTKSGRVMGVHQKIDRVAYRHVKSHIPKSFRFPTAHEILHFEGLNGPDGVKRKSPGKDEPWHYIDPTDPDDRAIVDMINDHIYNMATALKEKNGERASFEAAWMAHAIVDGLTPAHHYPLEEKLEELRGGEGLETRRTTKDKLLLPGKTRRIQLRNNWEFWGAKGVMTTHLAFELGVATAIAPLRLDDAEPSKEDFAAVSKNGFESVYFDILHEIDDMKMYEEFSRQGWSRQLARETRDILVPSIIKAVTLAWYQAVLLARKDA